MLRVGFPASIFEISLQIFKLIESQAKILHSFLSLLRISNSIHSQMRQTRYVHRIWYKKQLIIQYSAFREKNFALKAGSSRLI